MQLDCYLIHFLLTCVLQGWRFKKETDFGKIVVDSKVAKTMTYTYIFIENLWLSFEFSGFLLPQYKSK